MKKKLMRFNLAALALVMVTSVLISGTFAKYTTAVSAQDTALIARWDISSQGTGFAGEGDEALKLFEHAYNTAILNNDGETEAKFILGPGVEDSFTVNLTGTADVAATIDLQITKTGNVANAPIQYAIETGVGSFDWGDTDSYELYYSEELLAQAILDKMLTTADKPANLQANTVGEGEQERVEATATTPGKRAIILKESEEVTTANVEVHWRWPFYADAENAEKNDHDQDKLKAAFGRGTDWTDADDTALGIESAAAVAADPVNGVRDSYGLVLTLTAEQMTPSKP